MAQTPKSVSANLTGQVASTVYTVPSATTAVVKTALGSNVTGGNSLFTISKVSGGIYYPLTVQQNPIVTPATGGTANNAINLLSGPVTLAANESISVYDSATAYYKFTQTSNNFTTTTTNNYAILTQAYGNGVYLQIGQDTQNNCSFLVRSTDATTWTEIATGNQLPVKVAYYIKNIGSTWVACAWNSPLIMYSTDNGLTWATYNLTRNVYSLEANSTTFAIGSSNGLYTSTNGSSWTANSAFATYIGTSISGNAYSPQTITWNGTYWFISNNVGTCYTSDLSTFTGLFSGAGGGTLGLNQWCGCNYSPAYSKYYSVGNGAGTADYIYSSSNGFIWSSTVTGTNIFSSSYNRTGAVACAGSNTLLFAKPSQPTANMLKSTDGSTWSTTTDVRGYTGSIYGMANGYFIVGNSNTGNTSLYITNDPSSVSGTTISISAGGSQFFGAASNPSGNFVAVYRGTGPGNNYCAYGTGNNTWTSTSTINSISIYGSISGVLWWSAANVFVAYSVQGYYWTSPTGATWTLVNYNFAGVNNADAEMVACGNYLFCSGSSNTSSYISYANVNTYTLQQVTNVSDTSFYNDATAYQFQNLTYRNIYYGYTPGAFATDGTNVLFNGIYSNVFIITPTITPNHFRTPGVGGIVLERVNSQDIIYSGLCNGNSTYGKGFLYSSNITTTLPSTYATTITVPICYNNSNGPGGYPNPTGMFLYYGSNYYFRPDQGYGNIFVSTSLAGLGLTSGTFNISSTSIGGVNTLGQTTGYMSNRNLSDGTNFVTFNYGTVRAYKSTSPQNAQSTSVFTLSIVEVS
jgi:hypothetical protein